MTKTELKADMELTKISIQAFIAFLFAIMLQVITEKISMQIYSGFTIFALLMIVALMRRYKYLARELGRLEE